MLVVNAPGKVRTWLEELSTWRRVALVVLVLFSLASIPPLVDLGEPRLLWVVLGILVVGLLGLVSRYCRALTLTIGPILVPWLCVIGFNWIWHEIDAHIGLDLDIGLTAGLITAGVIFAAAAFCYLVIWPEHLIPALLVAPLLAVANVVGIPLAVSTSHDESHVKASEAVSTKVDVAIVVPGGAQTPLGRLGGFPQVQTDWDLSWSVARATGEQVDWLLLDNPDEQAAAAAARGNGPGVPGTPALRDGADHVLLLDVDGTPPVTPDPDALNSVRRKKEKISYWLRLADRIDAKAQVAVLLQTTDETRVQKWRDAVSSRGGSVGSVQTLGTRSLTDAVQVLAVQAEGASEALRLAVRYRPVLLFDGADTLAEPFDIESFLDSGRVDLCHDDQVSLLSEESRCNPISRSADLVGGTTHLDIQKAKKDDDPIANSLYVHPTRGTEGARKLLYLDYWWYLDGNPAEIGQGTSCGAGLAIPGKTCFDHVSDWEGMTVVLDVSDEKEVPVALQYAQHNDVVRYDYEQVRAYWQARRSERPDSLSPALLRNFKRVDDVDRRPLAFVAARTHATYWTLCRSRCHQVAEELTERGHDGEKWWPGNDTAHCLFTNCVQLLPTRHRGRDAALWNAYDGVWGDRDCILRGAYCSAELSPSAPSTQGRYQDPAKITGYVDEKWDFQPCGGKANPCPPLSPVGR